MPEQPRILLTESSDPTNLLFWKAVDIEYFVDGDKRTAYYFPLNLVLMFLNACGSWCIQKETS
ncbi:MAG: hypothetical protein VXW87_04485 [Pseudomonadota bacterium]|nr:hypothetical protein [Pseudomonadota bacterium]